MSVAIFKHFKRGEFCSVKYVDVVFASHVKIKMQSRAHCTAANQHRPLIKGPPLTSGTAHR